MMLSLPLLVTLASCSTFATAILIQDTTQSSFETLLKDNNLLFAAFSSRTFEPVQPFHDVFAEAASTVKTPCVIIDCDKEDQLCKEQDVNAYPAVRLFAKGEDKPQMTRYRGRRTKNAIRSFLTKHEMPVVTHVEPEDLQAFKTIDDIVIVAYLRPDQDALQEVFRSAASKHHRGFVFGYSTNMDAADAEGLAMPSIVCYKNTDGDNKVMSGRFSESDVEKFLETAKKTLIGEFSERNIDAYMAPGKLTAYIFCATEDEATALRRELTHLAKKFEKYVTFGVADAVEYRPMAQNFGLQQDKFPALAVHAPMNDNVFTYRQGRNIMAATVDAMLTLILQGKAASGQVFGDEAPEVEAVEAQESRKGHDEL